MSGPAMWWRAVSAAKSAVTAASSAAEVVMLGESRHCVRVPRTSMLTPCMRSCTRRWAQSGLG